MKKVVPRLSIAISEEQASALQEIFPFGTKKSFFDVLINWLIYSYDKNGKGFLVDFYVNQNKFDAEFLPYLAKRRKTDDATKELIAELTELFNLRVETDPRQNLRKLIKLQKEVRDGNGL